MAHRFPRSVRVADRIKEEMSLMLMSGEIKDHRLVESLVTVTKAEVSHDLQFARIFLSATGSEQEREGVISALKKAKGFIRHLIASRIDLRKVPDIDFVLDKSYEAQMRIESLLRQGS